MKLTAQLKKWLSENAGVKADASDEDFRKAAGIALANGDLSTTKFMELTKADDRQATQLEQQLSTLGNSLTKLTEMLASKSGEQKQEEKKEKEVEPLRLKAAGDQPGWFSKMVSTSYGTDGVEGNGVVEVKGAWSQYSTTKSTLTYPTHTKTGRSHPLAGRPVTDFAERGRILDNPSELDKAVAGAYSKFLVATAQRGNSKTFGYQALNQHDRELLQYAMHEMEWGGSSDGGDYGDINRRRLSDLERKALIDDATSGGLEAAPIVFDDMVIQTPLLNGELFPLVNTVPLERGRRVEGVSTGTVTGSWGGVDDTAISLFNTASYVSAFDTTIFRWQGAIRIGLDFLSDTPIDFGAHVSAQYGERLLKDLDDVIATGNGTTQPEGIINKSGTTSVSFGGSTTIGAYESLRFGVAKQEHRPNVAGTAVFCGTETSYMRAKAIPVGASDARRLSGYMVGNGPYGYSDYTWMERPYKINSSLSNAQIFYAILGRYRMYRRRGLTMRTSTEGDTLIRANEMLMTVTARYGGQLERGGCAAITTTAPA